MKTRLTSFFIVIAAFIGFASAGAECAHAATTITVMNTNDGGPGSLRQALADATDGDTIIVPTNLGVYYLDAAKGALRITSNLTLVGTTPRGAPPSKAVIDGRSE